MSVVDTIENVRDWIDINICQKVWLKLPGDDNANVEYNQKYELVHPSTFALYIPAKDKLPPGIKTNVPSICIQMTEGSNRLTDGVSTFQLRLMFSAWDPGLHGKDWLMPVPGEELTYKQWDTPKARKYYERRSEGWRDIWNFVDTALRVIESHEFIAGCRLVKEEGISYGPMTEADAVPDYSPYWYAWMSFALERGLLRDPKTYSHLL